MNKRTCVNELTWCCEVVSINEHIPLDILKETCRILNFDGMYLTRVDIDVIKYCIKRMKKHYHARDTKKLTIHEIKMYKQILREEGYYVNYV